MLRSTCPDARTAIVTGAASEIGQPDSRAGIQVARGSRTAVVARASALLAHVLTAGVPAMDETPIKAARKGRGKIQQAYFWPLYGEADEIRFSRSRAGAPIERALADRFNGVLLTDGYAAYKLLWDIP